MKNLLMLFLLFFTTFAFSQNKSIEKNTGSNENPVSSEKV
jgi:hypothetical protein